MKFRLLLHFLVVVLSVGDAIADKPNVVMIISDDQAWTDYGFMGHKQIATPSLDKLAASSLTFTNGYVPSSLCCPSLASMITGRYPHQHKITSNDPPIPPGMKPKAFQASDAFKQGRDRMNAFMDAQETLPRLLVKNGYLALQTGKWWQGDYKHGGFTHGMTKGGRHGDEGLDIGRKTMQPIYDFLGEAKQAQKPFFVWYAPMMPHDPHTPPKELLDKYLKIQPNEHIAKYYAMIEWFDQTIGDLLDHLDKQGVAENTIVVFLSDNGWIQDPAKERYAEKSKQSPYDGGLRTPIMVRYPARLTPKTSHTPVISLDILPTVLKLTDIEAPSGLPGLNLLDEAALKARPALFGEIFSHNAQDLDNPAASLRYRWVRQGAMKLIVPARLESDTTDAGTQLYDLTTDPAETHNLASDKPELVLKLGTSLDQWWKP